MRLLIADDHKLLRDTLGAFLELEKDRVMPESW